MEARIIGRGLRAGLHQALHPLPARNEWGGPRRGETNKNAPPLPGPLLHPIGEREKSRSLMRPWDREAPHGFCTRWSVPSSGAPRKLGARLWAKPHSQPMRTEDPARTIQRVATSEPAAAGPSDTAALRTAGVPGRSVSGSTKKGLVFPEARYTKLGGTGIERITQPKKRARPRKMLEEGVPQVI